MATKLAAIMLSLVFLVGCSSNPNQPTALDGMQNWALAHAHDVCLSDAYGKGFLIPLTSLPDYAFYSVRPISYCNPAEMRY